jgi:hypothetical protein
MKNLDFKNTFQDILDNEKNYIFFQTINIGTDISSGPKDLSSLVFQTKNEEFFKMVEKLFLEKNNETYNFNKLDNDTYTIKENTNRFKENNPSKLKKINENVKNNFLNMVLESALNENVINKEEKDLYLDVIYDRNKDNSPTTWLKNKCNTIKETLSKGKKGHLKR